MRHGIYVLALGVTILVSTRPAHAAPGTSIVLDGSLGPGGLVPSSSPGFYSITPAMGKTVGPNLFQSLGTFNLGTGDTADFVTTADTQNIIARVTGGSSTIDGTLTSTVGPGGPLSGATLFLINPAGIIFTANAHLNLGGSMVLTTANVVRLSDGSMFYGDLNHPLSDHGLTSAPVSAFGFMPPTGQTPAAISFAGCTLAVPASAGFQLVGGEIDVAQASLLAPGGNLGLFSAAGAGDVPFDSTSPLAAFNGTTVTAFGPMNFSGKSETNIDGPGGGSLAIRGGKIVVNQSYITAETTAARGGNVNVQAKTLTIQNGGFIGTQCTSGSGDAGAVTVLVSGSLTLTGEGSQISANTFDRGIGGVVDVQVKGALDLNRGDIFANTEGGGDGGTVEINAASLSMEGDGSIASLTQGAGAAGTVDLSVGGSLVMRDTSSIRAATYSDAPGGDILISADGVTMRDEAQISASSFFNDGAGGEIHLNARSLNITGSGTEPVDTLGITAETQGPGDGGDVYLKCATITLGGGAEVSSSSRFSTGDAGGVTVTCADAALNGRSSISASSQFSTAGTVDITARQDLRLTGGSTLNTAAAEDGGDITLHVRRLVYLLNSSIIAYAGTARNVPGLQGGNIDIDPELLVLDQSLISANDLSPQGRDGNILNTASFFLTDDSLLRATGQISTTPPDLDLAGQLLSLRSDLVDEQKGLRESCTRSVSHDLSTLTVVGRGGIPPMPDELQPDFGLTK